MEFLFQLQLQLKLVVFILINNSKTNFLVGGLA